MKTLLAILIAATTAAHAININWIEDSTTSFAVTIVGTGLGWNDTFSSPSGLWEMNATARTLLFPDLRGPMVVELNQYATVTFLGSEDRPILFADPYHNLQPVYSQIFDSNAFHFVSLDYPPHQGLLRGWNGSLPFVITDIPDPTDTSSWSWLLHIFASGPAHEPVGVPEGGSMVIGFLTLLILPVLRDYLALRKRMR